MIKTFAVLIVATASLASIVAPASAASASTRAFMENASPNVDFLDQSSRLAITNSKNAKIKAFAREEARDQTLTANAFFDWSSQVPSIQGTKSVAGEPVLQTGRSVAVDPVNISAPLGQEQLDALYGLDGKDFDDMYKQHQHDALVQVQSGYENYLATGDDPVLKTIAARELPKVKKQLDALAKL